VPRQDGRGIVGQLGNADLWSRAFVRPPRPGPQESTHVYIWINIMYN